MRILIATYTRALVGGVEKYLQALIPVLRQRGHSVALLYEQPSRGVAELNGLGERGDSWCATEMGFDSVLATLADWKPDIVYAQGLEDQRLESALLDQYPTILYAHTYNATCISGRKCHAWPQLQPCTRELGPACLMLYHVRRCGGINPLTMWQLFKTQSERKRGLTGYQTILVASRHMHDELARHGASPDHLQVLPLFPTDATPQASAPARRDPGGRILYIGRLMDVKGVDYLLSALPIASKTLDRTLALTIAGDGGDREKLENMAKRLDVAVEFTGWVDGEEKRRLMSQASLVAVPSLWPEPFGLVGIEAGCYGVPTVGFAAGGIPDWLIPGQTGELAPADPPKPAELADAIVRALKDAGHHHQLRVGAWEMSKRFSCDRHIGELERIFAGAASSAASVPVAVGK